MTRRHGFIYPVPTGTLPRIERCPFCFCQYCQRPPGGAFAILYGLRGSDLYFVRCHECGTSTNNYNTTEAAVAAWNRRVQREKRRKTSA